MNEKILVIDDEQKSLDLISTRLEFHGYRVMTAKNGSLGIKRAQEEHPDLIISDIMMTDMQGGEVVHSLQSRRETKDIPVIFLSGVCSPQGHKQANQKVNVAGQYYSALAKPWQTEQLLELIKQKLIERYSRETPRAVDQEEQI